MPVRRLCSAQVGSGDKRCSVVSHRISDDVKVKRAADRRRHGAGCTYVRSWDASTRALRVRRLRANFTDFRRVPTAIYSAASARPVCPDRREGRRPYRLRSWRVRLASPFCQQRLLGTATIIGEGAGRPVRTGFSTPPCRRPALIRERALIASMRTVSASDVTTSGIRAIGRREARSVQASGREMQTNLLDGRAAPAATHRRALHPRSRLDRTLRLSRVSLASSRAPVCPSCHLRFSIPPRPLITSPPPGRSPPSRRCSRPLPLHRTRHSFDILAAACTSSLLQT